MGVMDRYSSDRRERAISSAREERRRMELGMLREIDEIKNQNLLLEKSIASMDAKISALSADVSATINLLQNQNSVQDENASGNTSADVEQLRSEITELLVAKDSELLELQGVLSDKIHTESVKSYRNIKSLIDNLNIEDDDNEISEESLKKIRKSFKAMKVYTFVSFLGTILFVIFVLSLAGIIDISKFIQF